MGSSTCFPAECLYRIKHFVLLPLFACFFAISQNLKWVMKHGRPPLLICIDRGTVNFLSSGSSVNTSDHPISILTSDWDLYRGPPIFSLETVLKLPANPRATMTPGLIQYHQLIRLRDHNVKTLKHQSITQQHSFTVDKVA